MQTYFAFGSNLNQESMKARCPQSEVLGKAVLKDYTLGFNIYSTSRQCGCADIVPSPGNEVYGLLYRISDMDLIALDKYEAHPDKYRRFNTQVINEQGKLIDVFSYSVVDKEHHAPSDAYLSPIIEAAEKLAFPSHYIQFLKNIRTKEMI